MFELFELLLTLSELLFELLSELLFELLLELSLKLLELSLKLLELLFGLLLKLLELLKLLRFGSESEKFGRGSVAEVREMSIEDSFGESVPPIPVMLPPISWEQG